MRAEVAAGQVLLRAREWEELVAAATEAMEIQPQLPAPSTLAAAVVALEPYLHQSLHQTHQVQAAPASSSFATSVRLAPLAEPSRPLATTPCTRSRHRELSH
jgi:hypothetical protein